ncbi:MAG TPA: MFS transporter [Minicystis sp.]|nr:MFS transporter [Minicystis sp.]
MIQGRFAIVLLLTALNLINYIDRFLVMAVAPRIQESLALTDAQVGWVTSAFMLGYFVTSPVFGWLGDRMPRKVLIAIGVLVWSAATALSGTAKSFESMVAMRVLVGVGEASYATLSPTIIDDIATPAQKNKLLAVFYVAIPVGSALGFVLGGLLEHAYGWRSAFFFAGGPGVLLSLVTLFIREPASAGRADARSGGKSYAALARFPLYRDTVLGYVAQTFALGGFTAWAATYLYRKLCLELRTGDLYFGAITVVTGLVGTFVGGVLADRWPGVDRTRAALRVCAWSSIVAAPLALGALLMPNAVGFLVMMALCELALFASVAPTNVAVLQSVPSDLRARAMAASIFAIHLFGDFPSPPVVGSVSDLYHDAKGICTGAAGLGRGMLLLPLAIALSAAFWWRGSRPQGTTTERPA